MVVLEERLGEEMMKKKLIEGSLYTREREEEEAGRQCVIRPPARSPDAS
jgi:hypothetical protein